MENERTRPGSVSSTAKRNFVAGSNAAHDGWLPTVVAFPAGVSVPLAVSRRKIEISGRYPATYTNGTRFCCALTQLVKKLMPRRSAKTKRVRGINEWGYDTLPGTNRKDSPMRAIRSPRFHLRAS